MAFTNWKPALSLLLVISVLVAATSGDGTENHQAASKSKGGPRKNSHPLPPVVMPGILADHGRRRREARKFKFIPEKYSSSLDLPVGTLIRTRRSPNHPKPIPEIPIRSRRNKRDLRRLRRDLDYATEYAQPYRGRGIQYEAYPSANFHQMPDSEGELRAFLQGADLLDRLSILKQMQGILPAFRPVKQWSAHGPPSRFAPQPKLFEDDAPANFRPLRVQATPLGWSAPKPKGVVMWSPQKRWPTSHPGDGLAMVPGFKRSAFREEARKHADELNLPKKEMLTLASILGAEIDPTEGRIRRRAM